MRYVRLVVSALLSCIATASFATIEYTVKPLVEEAKLRVTIAFEGSYFNEVQMPNWRPGSYRLIESARGFSGFSVTDSKQQVVRFVQPNFYTWKFVGNRGERYRVQYEVPMTLDTNAYNYHGPHTYAYLVGRKDEDCRLKLELPMGWKSATGLKELQSPHEYEAPDYDTFADCPVSFGDLRTARYFSHGVPHDIVIRGRWKHSADMDHLLMICKKVSDLQGEFFGGLPFDHYVWHFVTNQNVTGGSGLEHLNSTQITFAGGLGNGMTALFSHEYFHIWNVKRIRSQVLGPFDYTKLPVTEALWWLEGVTDYYADLLLTRYKLFDEAEFYSSIVSNTGSVLRNAAHKEVSATEASRRVREANNGVGNSDGYRISYYSLGWFVGLLLDIEMRDLTNGRHSLDDVLFALWEQCKDGQPGFAEDEIRKQMVIFGGSKMGEFYDLVVTKPGNLPLETQLLKVGLKQIDREIENPQLPFSWAVDFEKGGIRVTRVDASLGENLKVGDILTHLNDVKIPHQSVRSIAVHVQDLVKASKPGNSISFQFMRGDEKLSGSGKFIAVKTTGKSVVPIDSATPRQLMLRHGLLFGKSKR